MGIEAKGSSGVYAECPKCNHAMQHGFQVCQNCGHTVSAEEHSKMQKLLAGNVIKFSVVGLALFAVTFYLLSGF